MQDPMSMDAFLKAKTDVLIAEGRKQLQGLNSRDKGFLSYAAWCVKELGYPDEELYNVMIGRGINRVFASLYIEVGHGDLLINSPVRSMAKVRPESVPHAVRSRVSACDEWLTDTGGDRFAAMYICGNNLTRGVYGDYALFRVSVDGRRKIAEDSKHVFKGISLQVGTAWYHCFKEDGELDEVKRELGTDIVLRYDAGQDIVSLYNMTSSGVVAISPFTAFKY